MKNKVELYDGILFFEAKLGGTNMLDPATF